MSLDDLACEVAFLSSDDVERFAQYLVSVFPLHADMLETAISQQFRVKQEVDIW